MGTTGSVQASALSGEFCMFDGTGAPVNGGWATTCDQQVTGDIDNGAGTFSVSSTQLFFGQAWSAHGGTTFGPGTYSFNTIQGGTYTGIVVGSNQVGGHILFDWGVVTDIDVVLVWNVTLSSVNATTILETYTSTDNVGSATGQPALPSDPYNLQDGILGNAMADGAFIGFNANFNFSTQVPDVTPPVITLNGVNPQTVVIGGTYVEAGATCTDAVPQQAFTYTPVISGTVITGTLGDYTISYDCDDANGNSATTVQRTVSVVPPDAVTTLLGVTPFSFECDSTGNPAGTQIYVDAGAQCSDPDDGTWTSADPNPPGTSLVLTGTPFDETAPGGPFSLTWTCTDSSANTGTAIREVNVVDTFAPVPGPFTQNDSVGTLVGDVLTLETNDQAAYANLNPTLESVLDSCDTTVPAVVMTSDTVDFNIVSGNVVTSTLNYTTTDASGNVMDTPLTVNVNRSEPVITLVGDNLILNVGEAYVEQGVDIFDAQDGSISSVTASGVVTPTSAGTDPASPRDLTVTIDSSAVDTSTAGVYDVTYDVTDFDGNTAVQVTRTVTVGVFASGSNFTMLDAQGNVFGGTNDVIFDWDQSTNNDQVDYTNNLNFNMDITSQLPFPFFGFVWTAHDTRVFGPGTYSFDTGCTVAEIKATGCPAGSAANSGPTITMTVPCWVFWGAYTF